MSARTVQERRKVDVVVLMAGEGRRLRPLTNDRPKGLLCCDDGISIFTHLVRSFVAHDWDVTIIPVIGHGWQKVCEELTSLKEIATFDYVCNPFYNTAGPLVSLWLGMMQSKSDGVVFLNGDTLIKESLVKEIVPWMYAKSTSEKPEVGLCVSQTTEFEKDDMKVSLHQDGSFGKAGKDLEIGPVGLKSAGVLCVRNAQSKDALREKLDQLIMDEKSLSKKYFWHNIVNEVKGLLGVDLLEVKSNCWYEVDTPLDLESMN